MFPIQYFYLKSFPPHIIYIIFFCSFHFYLIIFSMFKQQNQQNKSVVPVRENQTEIDIQTRKNIISPVRIQEQSSSPKNFRRTQPMPLFVLVALCETVTIFLSLMLKVTPYEYKQYMYLTFIILTVVRSTIFMIDSIYLIGCGKKIFQLYFLLDNTFVMMIASVITYIFLNHSVQIQFAIPAIICYPILLFFLVGNFRVMLLYCNWRPCQVIIYKVVKIVGATYFLLYGSFLTINSESNNDMLLLWIFTTCGFWAEMCFCVNTFDKSDGLSTSYQLQDD